MDKILLFVLPHYARIGKSVSIPACMDTYENKVNTQPVMLYWSYRVLELVSKFESTLPLNYCISYVNKLTTALLKSIFAPHTDI